MKYRLTSGAATLECVVTEEKDGILAFEIDGRAFRAACRYEGGGKLVMDVDGQGVTAHVRSGRGGKHVVVEGAGFFLTEVRAGAAAAGAGADDAGGDVSPPMPAEVVRVLVKEGDAVEKGQGLIVVSAMKMEITLRAPAGGTVRKIHAAPGDKVAPGKNLVDLD
jgi:3-methylcrotonyl-CoA carboxylase alpha subunit